MKRICWLTPENFLETDIHVVPELVKYFQINWEIISIKGKNDFKNEINKLKSINGLNLNYNYLPSRHRSLKPLLFYIKLLLKVRATRPDIIFIVISGMPYLMPLSRMFFPKRKVIVSVHNVSTPFGAQKAYLSKLYNLYTLNSFKNFHTYSRSQQDILKKKYRNKNVYFTPFILKDYGMSKTSLNNVITFLNFGNIIEYKRIDVLIEASQKAYEETGIKFKVIIAGSCSDWYKYEKLIRYPELFEFHIKYIPNSQIPDLFGQSHYFVAPYQDIAQSGATMVGINYDKPIIASDLPSFNEIIEDGVTGYIMRPASVNDLTKIISLILTSKNKVYGKLQRNVINLKSTYFSKERIINLYKDFFNSIQL